jgi:hypothetical protein
MIWRRQRVPVGSKMRWPTCYHVQRAPAVVPLAMQRLTHPLKRDWGDIHIPTA